MVIPGYYTADNSPTYAEVLAAERRAAAERRRARERAHRINILKREIMFAKMKRKEYDRFLAELGVLQQEQLDSLKEAARQGCAAPRRR